MRFLEWSNFTHSSRSFWYVTSSSKKTSWTIFPIRIHEDSLLLQCPPCHSVGNWLYLSPHFTGHSDMSCLSIGSFESKNYIYYLDIAWGCARCQGSWRGSSESCRKGSSWRKSREWGKSDEGRNGDLRGSELRRKAQEKNESQAMWTVEFSEVMSPLWPSFLKPWSSRFGAT